MDLDTHFHWHTMVLFLSVETHHLLPLRLQDNILRSHEVTKVMMTSSITIKNNGSCVVSSAVTMVMQRLYLNLYCLRKSEVLFLATV